MIINIRNSYENPSFSGDLTVFIDIFRASTTLAYLLNNNAKNILGLNCIETAKEYMKNGYKLFSEVHEGGFDNSPSRASRDDIPGADIIHMSGNLTNAIFGNFYFENAIVAGFVNISETVRHIRKNKYKKIDIIASSHYSMQKEAVEDTACAKMIKTLLQGEKTAEIPDMNKISDKIQKRRTGDFKFPDHYWTDVSLALKTDTVPVIPEIIKENKNTVRYRILK